MRGPVGASHLFGCVDGVALGAGTGHIVSILIISRLLFGGGSRVHVRARHLRPDPAAMRQILGLAWPPAVQMIGNFMVTVFFIRLMGDFGDKAQAAYSIGLSRRSVCGSIRLSSRSVRRTVPSA